MINATNITASSRGDGTGERRPVVRVRGGAAGDVQGERGVRDGGCGGHTRGASGCGTDDRRVHPHRQRRAAERAGHAAVRHASSRRAVARRTEAGIAPRASPHGRRIDLRAHMSFLVTDQSTVGCGCPGNAVFKARLPKDLIPTKETEMHPRRTRGFHIGSLASRPIFIMPNR